MNRAHAAARTALVSESRKLRFGLEAARPLRGPARSNQATQRLLLAGVQAKLSVSEPGDALEREADHAADEVMRMPAPAAAVGIEGRAGPNLQRKCAACGGEHQGGKPKCAACAAEERGAQRKPDGAATGKTTMPSHAAGAGAPLAADVRAFFEPRFQRDFGGVRIHTGAQASSSARSLSALAYTAGRDVVFGEGQYAPGTSAGRRLLAHELAHVVQQADEPAARRRIQRQPEEEEELPDAPPEVEPLPPVEPPGPEPQVACKFDIFKRELECCAPAPGVGRICAPDPFTVKKKIEEALARMRKKKRPRKPSPGIDVCPEAQRIPSPAPPPYRAGGCCPEGTFWSGNRCRRIPVTPSCSPELCKEDEIFLGVPGYCCVPREAKPPPPPPPPPKERVSTSHEVFFQFDRPAGEATDSAAFDRSVTSEGKTNFDMLVAQLKADPALKVQLIGGASAEGPDPYNFDLGRRRALAVAAALARAGIDRSRIADPPENDLRGECKEVGSGLRSCGEAGATGPRDRRVLARVFEAR